MLTLLVHKSSQMSLLLWEGREVRSFTKSLKLAYESYSRSSRTILNRHLKALLDHLPQTAAELANQDSLDARAALETYLKNLGCTFHVARGPALRLGISRIKTPAGHAAGVSIFINFLASFYFGLAHFGVRKADNPLQIDGWADYSLGEQAHFINNKKSRTGESFPGLAYQVSIKTPYKPRVLDAAGFQSSIMNAATLLAFPDTIIALLRLLMDSGVRLSEIAELALWDWWRGSTFGLAIRAPNKGAKHDPQRRVKDLAMTPETHAALVALVAPIDDVIKLARSPQGRETLQSRPLFPNAKGGFYSAWTLRNRFFNPAAKHAGAMILTGEGVTKFATPHATRHHFITQEVMRLDHLYPDETDFERELIDLAAYLHCSPSNLANYAAEAFRRRNLAKRLRSLQTMASSPSAPPSSLNGRATYAQLRGVE